MPRIRSLSSSEPEPQPNGGDSRPPNQQPDGSAPPAPVPGPATHSLDLYTVARPIDVEPPGEGVPYVQVYHPSCRRSQAITRAIPNVREGDPVLICGDRIQPVSRLHLIHAAQYYTNIAVDDGRILAISRTRPADCSSPLKEHIESLVLVYTPEGVVAAKAAWRRTRSRLAKVMAAALKEREGRWAEFTGTPRIESRTSRDDKAYSLVTADVNPTNADDARLLQAWRMGEEAQKEFARVKAAYEQRLRSLDSMAT
jgi:hypothetical protein